jgi:hypothetical protein
MGVEVESALAEFCPALLAVLGWKLSISDDLLRI